MSLSRALLVCAAVSSFSVAHAQSGCTDPLATNYNPAATVNDGSCVYPITRDTPVLKAVLPSILHESSGVIWTDGKLWTHNDSGNPNDIFSIDTTTGAILQTVYVDNFTNIDWEDITADSNYIYISDCGNNDGDRQNLRVLKVAKSDITSDSVVHLSAEAINLSYADQTSFTPSSTNNFDCESILSIRDSLYLFSKDRGDSSTRVYKLPKTPGTYVVPPYTGYPVDGLITGADYNLQTKEVVLIGYKKSHINSFMWFLSDYKNDSFFSGNKRRIEIGNNTPWQTEGVCWVNGRLFITNETDSKPASLYATDTNWIVAAPTAVTVVAGVAPSCLVYPNPFTNRLTIAGLNANCNYRIISVAGQEIATGTVSPSQCTINTGYLVPGNYFLVLTNAAGIPGTTTIVKQ